MPWDEKVSERLAHTWVKFTKNLLDKAEMLRGIPSFKEPFEGVVLHAFGDTSVSGISAPGESKGLISSLTRAILFCQSYKLYLSIVGQFSLVRMPPKRTIE